MIENDRIQSDLITRSFCVLEVHRQEVDLLDHLS